MDDTSQKIIDATMSLIRDKGYVATTTRDIARLAGVNECTLFRKFQNKKDIVLQGVAQEKWRANVTPDIFQNVVWDLEPDLEMFMNAYMDRITPDFVNLSIGLRAPQLYEETAPLIMKVPQAFVSALTEYFRKMEELGKIAHFDFESLAMTVFSSTFGYTFLSASFHQELVGTKREAFIKNSVKIFVDGIAANCMEED
jgi:AcrR family transcriptional regulator